mgnify:CR=1 FL=1
MKKWYKSKTILFGILACIYGVIKGIAAGPGFEELAAIWAGLQTIFLRLGMGNVQ